MQIAILGSWDNDLDQAIYEVAETIGRLIAERGDVLFTGGSTGVMQAAMKGAKSAKAPGTLSPASRVRG